jgi:ERCC4-type nuclease
MRAYFLRDVFLWPRFHTVVQADLSPQAADDKAMDGQIVEEIKVPLTSRMKLMQVCLEDLLNSTRHELLRSHRGLKMDGDQALDTEEEAFSGGRLDNDVVVSEQFESVLQAKLERLNRVLSVRTRQVLDELRTLRLLHLQLTRLTPLAYQQLLQQVAQLANDANYQFWLADAAQALHATSLERIEKRELPPKLVVLSQHLLAKELAGKRVLLICQDTATKDLLERVLSFSLSEACYPEQTEADIDEPFKEKMDELITVESFDELDLDSVADVDCLLLYDSCLEVVRLVEVHLAVRRKERRPPLRLLHVLYAESVDEQRYLREIRAEKKAFDRLIHLKTVMVMPETVVQAAEKEQDNEIGEEDRLIEAINAGIFGASSSNKTGHSSHGSSAKRVVVDLRELRSPLPFLLHKHGFVIDPQTLPIGDYLLQISSTSPSSYSASGYVSVERKSVADLVSSLNSGRLVEQATALCQHFKYCVLLIEFERGRPFTLQTSDYVRAVGKLSTGDVSAKLCLLLLHFPRLRLWWSSSPLATCCVFSDVIDCLGSEGSEGRTDAANETKTDASEGMLGKRVYNQSIKDALLFLPGVNDRNVHVLMGQFASVRGLLRASRADLQACLEPAQADLMHQFLHSTREA